jgi:hypothetical protein
MASEQAKREGAAEQGVQIGISAQGNLEQMPQASKPGESEQKPQEGQAIGMQQRKEGEQKSQEGQASGMQQRKDGIGGVHMHPDARARFMQNRARKGVPARGYGARHVPTSPKKGPHLHEELQAEFGEPIFFPLSYPRRMCLCIDSFASAVEQRQEGKALTNLF